MCVSLPFMVMSRRRIPRLPFHHHEHDHVQGKLRQFFRGFPHRPDHPPRHAAHRHGRRRGALQRPVRAAVRGAIVRRLRAQDRLPALAGRRPAGVSFRLRQVGPGRLAQRRRQSRLCELPLPGACLSRRHAQCSVGGDRAQGELEPQDRDRVRPLVRLQAGRQQGAGICPLGDGAKARREGSGAARARSPAARHRHPLDARRRLSADRRSRVRFRPRRQSRPASAITRWARRSTMSTA